MSGESRPIDGTGDLDRSRPPGPGALRPFSFPRVHHGMLSNRMPVRIAEVRRMPVVTMSVLLDAGGMREAESRAGLATLTAELLQSGAGDKTVAQLAEAIDSLGVQLDCGASWNAASAGLTTLRSRLEPATELLSEIVRDPRFPESEVERLRAERIADIAQRRADPKGLATEVALRVIFSADSPFARPLGGTPATLPGLIRPDAVAFHAAHYSPDVATLLVVGDISTAEAMNLAERRFGGWAGISSPRPLPVARPRSTTAEVFLVDRPGAVQSEIRVGHVGVERGTAEYFPLVVMNTILGGAFSSRLNLNLRERHGFTYGASSSFSLRRQPGPFLISTAVQTEVTDRAIAEITREMEGMITAEVAPSELADARAYLAGVFPLRLQTTAGVAAQLAEQVVFDLADDFFDSYRDRILAVSSADVLRVARGFLHPEQARIVVVGDARKVREPLEKLRLGPVRIVDPAALDDWQP